VVLEVARENPMDGTRMVAALASREVAGALNRKRVQRLMREHRLLQPNALTVGAGGPATFRSRAPMSCGIWT
jgi:putative transposase